MEDVAEVDVDALGGMMLIGSVVGMREKTQSEKEDFVNCGSDAVCLFC